MSRSNTRVLIAVAGAILAFGGLGVAPAQALSVCGNIVSNTTWTVADSPVLVTCDTYVYPGVTLTIDPGVTVRVTPPYSLRIRGLLLAVGSPTQPVILTSASAPTKWGGISLETNNGGRGTIQFAQISYAYTGTSVQCCWGVNPPATILDSTYSNNDTAVGGYAGYNTEIRRSTFSNNINAISSADKRVFDSSFTFNGCGLCYAERTEVTSSTFSNNTTAVSVYQATIRNSTISNNSIGVDEFSYGATLTKNTITGNGTGVNLGYSSGAPKTYNNIHANSVYNVKVNGTANVALPNNYWGTTVSVTIDAGIRDGLDQAGLGILNYQTILTQAVTLDTTPPDTSITSAPPSLSNTSSASVAFVSSDLPATYACSLDHAAFSGCTSPAAFAGLTDGSHTFRVQATDNDMNTDPSPASSTWTIDTVAPDTSITSGPSGGNNPTGAAFSYTSTQPGATFRCSLDGAVPSLCGPSSGYADLSEGGHVFEVASVDAAGNVDPTPAQRIWGVDATAPVVTITQPDGPGTYVNGERVAIGGDTPVIVGSLLVIATAEEDGSGFSGLGNFSFTVDGEPVIPGVSAVYVDPEEPDTYHFTFRFEGYAPGAHEIGATATDVAGNSASDTVAVVSVG